MQERRDLTVILAVCFAVLFVAAFILVALTRSLSNALDRLLTLAAVAAVGTIAVLLLLFVVAYFDSRARRRINREATRLEEIMRQQQKLTDHDRTNEGPR